MKSTINSIIPILFLLICLLQTGQTAAVEISSSVSRNKVAVNESFQLTFHAEEDPDGEPDFTPLLEDFEILNQSQRQNMQVINGKVSRSISWDLTLIAGTAGVPEIPSISFGDDRSNPISIEIVASGSADTTKTGDNLFLKLEIEPESAYIQQQLLLRVRLYRTVMLGDASLSPPKLSDSDTIIQRMGEDSEFETMVDGRRYKVIERRYALFPQKSGTLKIGPVTFQGELFPATAGSNDIFLSPFRRFGPRGKIRRLKSEPISIEIRPIPASAKNNPWLPSDNLRLAEEWPEQAPEFRAGEPVTRTLMLFADGLTSAQLPPIKVVLPAGMKQYPDQPLLKDQAGADGITGIRQEKIALVPTKAGEYVLPAIEVPWWNTATDQPELAQLAERKILVHANPATAKDEQEIAAEPDQTMTKKTESPSPVAKDPIEKESSNNIWLWLLAVVLGAGWLLTAALGRWRKKHEWRSPKIEKPPSIEEPEERGVTLNEVKRSCLSNYPEIAATALLKWARQQWPESQPRSLGALARHLGGDAAKEIGILEKILYSPSTQTEWRGESLWNALEIELKSAPEEPDNEYLAPLHPT